MTHSPSPTPYTYLHGNPPQRAHVVGHLVDHRRGPVSGRVTFTPVRTALAIDADPPFEVFAAPVVVPVVDGRLSTRLYPNDFDLTFQVTGVTRPGYRITLTPDHSEDAPLSLALSAPR